MTLSNARSWLGRVFDPNTLWMHLIYGAVGLVCGFVDYAVFGVKPENEVLAAALAVCIIPPFLLPVAGIDKDDEKTALFFLTFGLSSAFFTIPGLALGSVWERGAAEPQSTLASLSLAWAAANAAAVYVSYLTVGHMSREERLRVHEHLLRQLPMVIQLAHGVLAANRQTSDADRLLRDLCDGTEEGLARIIDNGKLGDTSKHIIGVLQGVKFVGIGELEQALSQYRVTLAKIRKKTSSDGMSGAPRKKTRLKRR